MDKEQIEKRKADILAQPFTTELSLELDNLDQLTEKEGK